MTLRLNHLSKLFYVMSDAIRRPLVVKLRRMEDLFRIVATRAMSQKIVLPIYIWRKDDKAVLFFVLVLSDYYELRGVPMIHYVVVDANAVGDARYVIADLDERGERYQLSKTPSLSKISIPLIEVEKFEMLENLLNELATS